MRSAERTGKIGDRPRSSRRGSRPDLSPNLRAVLRDAVRRFEAAKLSYGHGTTNALDEAAWLILHALELPLDQLEPHLGRALDASEVQRIETLLDNRIRTRKPAAYLIREAWLGENRFYVDERALVPRSYIAELLRDDLRPWIESPQRIRHALDLCTGCGCIAILAALAFPRARVDAADISRDALDVARINVADYRLEARVKLVLSDLFSRLRGRPYDVILSNPPYVRETVMRNLPAEYRREPRLALAGGRDGLDVVRQIVNEASSHLNPGGLLVVEVGHNRPRVERAFPKLPLVWPVTSGGADCVFLITREALLAARAVPPRATRAGASPRVRAAKSPGRASAAAAGKRSRSERA
ncbi:MAG: 50S ribosomal protein L3 N(5)-glutamine methyltransferase [Burkholderiales bacterium]